jgi:uncharacterized coiled-coil DUF342 family protein
MDKLNEARKELKAFNEAFTNLQKERMDKLQELEKQKKERQKVIMEQWGNPLDGRTTKTLNQKIEQLEKDLAEIEEQLELAEQVKKDKFLPLIEELKVERAEVAQTSNKKIKELEKQLFKAKLEFMSELETAGREQNELQTQIDEYHSIISMFDSDRKETLEQFQMYAPDYLIFGDGMKAPVSPTDKEIHKIVHGNNSPHRLPFSFLVYRMSGEVIVTETEARERFHELQKGVK